MQVRNSRRARPFSFVRTLAALTVAALVAACGSDGGSGGAGGSTGSTGGPDGNGARRDTLVVAFPDQAEDLDDFTSQQRFEGTQYAEPLVIQNPATGELEPLLAAELPTMVDSEGKVWEVKLREGITFHDGSDFTSANVVEAIEYAAGVEDLAPSATAFGLPIFESAEAVDPLTVRFTFKAPKPTFPRGATYLKMQKITPDMGENPIGTGPYRFVSWTRGQEIVLEAWDGYWRDIDIPVQTIRILTIPDEGARLSALLAGEVDLVPSISPDQVQQVPHLITAAGGLDFRLVFDSREGPTADPEVRRALTLAIDRQGLIDSLFGGYGRINECQSLQEGYTGYAPDLKAVPFDPDEARRILEGAGVAGESIELLTAEGVWTKNSELMQAIAEMWKQVGVDATVRTQQFADFRGSMATQPGPRPDAYFVAALMRLGDAADLLAYVTSNGSLSSVSDPEIDALFSAADAVVDPVERDKEFQAFTQRLCDQSTLGFLFFPDVLVGAVEGISFTPDPVDVQLSRVIDFEFS